MCCQWGTHGFPTYNYVLEVIGYNNDITFKICKAAIYQVSNYRRIMKPRTSINSMFICAGEASSSSATASQAGGVLQAQEQSSQSSLLLLSAAFHCRWKGQQRSGDGHMMKIHLCFQEKAKCWHRIVKLLALLCCRISEKHQWVAWKWCCTPLIPCNVVITVTCKALKEAGQ